jgi:HSP20 family molecular chaperone IbpA
MSNLTLWSRRDPFADFDAAFNSIARRAFGGPVQSFGFVPAAELDRDGDDAVLKLELPGLDVAKDVDIEVDGNRLVVKGERRSQKSEEKNGSTWREFRYGSFERSFTIPEHVDADAITAAYDAGVLTVRVSGAYATPEPTAKRIAITSGAGAAEQPSA